MTENGIYYREWAPGAKEMYLTGDFNNWDRRLHKCEKDDFGTFELFLPRASDGTYPIQHNSLVKTHILYLLIHIFLGMHRTSGLIEFQHGSNLLARTSRQRYHCPKNVHVRISMVFFGILQSHSFLSTHAPPNLVA